MSYFVKELFLTLQGEGANAGRASVFCRFSGCNLWTGREEHRETAVCRFCDTDFVGVDGPGGGRFETAEDLAQAALETWGTGRRNDVGGRPLLVCTGGEPLLQLDEAQIAEFRATGFEVAIETNGTIPVPPSVDWVCVSPKAGAELVVTEGDELKVVFPQAGLDPGSLVDLAFTHFFLQPMDGPDREANAREAIAYCLEHPKWRLGLQTHKYLGIA